MNLLTVFDQDSTFLAYKSAIGVIVYFFNSLTLDFIAISIFYFHVRDRAAVVMLFHLARQGRKNNNNVTEKNHFFFSVKRKGNNNSISQISHDYYLFHSLTFLALSDRS